MVSETTTSLSAPRGGIGSRARRAHRDSRRPATIVAALLAVIALLGAACSQGPSTSEGDLASTAGDIEVPTLVPPTPTPVPIEPTPTPTGPAPIVIVSVLGETGVMKPLDAPALAGIAARIDEINNDGGVLGRPLELRRINTSSRLSVTSRLVERLFEFPPDLVIVSCDVEMAGPVLDAADEVGTITISPCADDVGYSTGAWGPRNFTLGAPAEPRGELAAEVAFERYGSTVMILRDTTSPEALRFCNGFESRFNELGGQVLYRDSFRYDTLLPLRDRLLDNGVEAASIAVCSHVPGGVRLDGAPSIVNLVRDVGFFAPIVAGSTIDEPTWFNDVPSLGEITFVTWSSVFGNDPDPRINDLVRRAGGDTETPPPGLTTALGADVIDLWAIAVERAQSLEPSRVTAALGSTSNEDLRTGMISFLGGSRMDIGREYRVMRVQGSEVDVPEIVTVPGA